VGPAARRAGTRAGPVARGALARDADAGGRVLLSAPAGKGDGGGVRRDLGLRIDDDLAEAHLGDWEGKPFEEILSSDDRMLHRVRNQEPIWRHAPGVEELGPFRGRVRDAIERILASHPSGNVLVVCHGGVINAYVAPLLGVDHEMFFVPENTSLNSVVVDGEARRVRFLNDALHLTDPHLFADAERSGP
jgi:broad specificity phosphatase PhoE